MLYYYKDEILSDDEELVKDWIAENIVYMGEEDLLRIFENEIYCIEDFAELLEYCIEYDFEMKDLYLLFGIDIVKIFRESAVI